MSRISAYMVCKTSEFPNGYDLPYLTNSMIEAINTCPRWGIVRNVQRKFMVTGMRQMALEFGSAMHEIFAMFNLYHLAKHQGYYDHAVFAGTELFGEGRMQAVKFDKHCNEMDNSDETVTLDSLAFHTMGTGEFYDDPNDKNRTLGSMQECASQLAVTFMMQHSGFPILVVDPKDPTKPVGIEQSLDVVFTVFMSDGSSQDIRFIGLADAVYQNPDTRSIKLGEYKTASSMNDAWMDSFKTRHQLTAYNGALAAYFKDEVSFTTLVTGSAVPVRKTTQPVRVFPIDRDQSNVIDFLVAAIHANTVRTDYAADTVIDAPMFTHSCNRYFRTCSLMDWCTAERNDRHMMWQNMIIDDELSPSEMKALMRNE